MFKSVGLKDLSARVAVDLLAGNGSCHMHTHLLPGQQASGSEPAGKVSPSAILHHSRQRVSMHLVTRLVRTEPGFGAVMAAVDQLPQMMHLMPTFATANAPTVAGPYIDGVHQHHGTLADLIVSGKSTQSSPALSGARSCNPWAQRCT